MTDMLKQACEEIERVTMGQPTTPSGPFTLADLEGQPDFFEIKEGTAIVYWGGYDYDISLHLISTPLILLGWIMQIGEKSWPLMTPDRIVNLIGAVCAEKGWNPHTGEISGAAA